MDLPTLTSTLLTGIFSGSLIMAAVAGYTAYQNKKARVSSDQREARRDISTDRDKLLEWYESELTLVNTDNKLLRDYVYTLRSQLPNPPPFPEGLHRV